MNCDAGCRHIIYAQSDFYKRRARPRSKVNYYSAKSRFSESPAAKAALSPQPSLLSAVVIFSNIGLRNAELRRARWSQVDFLKREFTVSRLAKTKRSALRVIPLNQAALAAFTAWRSRWPDAKPEDFIYPTQMLVFKGEGAAGLGVMTSYAVDRAKPLGSWKTSRGKAKKQAKVECHMHDLRHTLVSKLAELGSGPEIIRGISGHTNEQMSTLYTHISQKAKRDVLRQLDAPLQTVQ